MPDTSVSKLTIYGASDDLIELEGAIDDEYSIGSADDWEAIITADDKEIRVFAAYLSCGVWAVSAAPVEDGVPMPDWNIRLENAPDNDYSSALVMDLPTRGVNIQELKR